MEKSHRQEERRVRVRYGTMHMQDRVRRAAGGGQSERLDTGDWTREIGHERWETVDGTPCKREDGSASLKAG